MIQVTVETPEPCRRLLHLDVPPADVRPQYDEVVSRYVAEGRIPGFRSGKAPRHLIERSYENAIQDDFRRAVLPKCYQKALEQEQLKVVEIVSFENVQLSVEKGLSCDVTVDVAPEFELPAYRALKVPREAAAVEPSAVDAEIEALRAQLASYEPATAQHVAGDADLVQVDFQATADGQPLEQLVPESAQLARAEDAWVRVGQPDPGRQMFAGELEGLTAGAEKEFDYTFPDDVPVAGLRGRTAHYRVLVKAIRRQVPALLDEAFLQRIGVESEEALREILRKRLEQVAEQREEARRRERIIEFLLANADFDVPRSLKEQDSAALAQQLVMNGLRQGATREQLQEARSDILAQAGRQAEQRVRLSLVLLRIAAEEGISETREELHARLSRVAAERQTTVEKLLADTERPIDVEALGQDVRCAKVMQWLSESTLPKDS